MVKIGTCWISEGDPRMIEITDVQDAEACFVVVSPETTVAEGTIPVADIVSSWTALTAEQAEMRELYEQAGLSVRDISERYGVSVYTAYYRLRACGTHFRSSGVRAGQVYERTRAKERKKDHIRRRLSEGWSVRQISEELAISLSHAYQLAREVRESATDE
jgi:transposase